MVASVEHERDENTEEVELQMKWTIADGGDDEGDGDVV